MKGESFCFKVAGESLEFFLILRSIRVKSAGGAGFKSSARVYVDYFGGTEVIPGPGTAETSLPVFTS